MEYSLKWWQWAVAAVLVLMGGANALLSGGSIAAIYGQLTGVVIVSVAIVYVVVLAGRAVTRSSSSSTPE